MIPILSETDSYLLCVKPAGILSQPAPSCGESMLSLLAEQCGCSIYPIHRLDREVGGTMVFAKTQPAAARLSQAVRARSLSKTYLAIVQGCPAQPEGTYTDLLFMDRSRGRSFVVSRLRKGVKDASLSYQVLASRCGQTLVQILLHTGRSHQIRVQFASRGTPLLGDRKYGGPPAQGLALWSWRLECPAPPFSASSLPAAPLWDPFRDILASLSETSPPPFY